MPRIALIFSLLAVSCAAFATDYKISINAPAAEIAKTKAIHVYGFKFAKGDHIVEVKGDRQGASTGFRVSLDSNGSTGTLLVDHNVLDSFPGKVLSAAGSAPQKSYFASVDKVTVAAIAAEAGVGATAKSFVTSPSGYITFGALALLFVGAYFFRPKSHGTKEAWSLPNRRKSIDESLKDIAKRIEQIDENQRNLVKKPPMLRTFRAQVDGFEVKLKQLEGQLNSLQTMLVKTGESLGSLDRGQKDLKAQADSNDSAVKVIAGSLDSAKSSVSQLSSALQELGQQQAARTDEVLNSYGKQALEIQNKLSGIEGIAQKAVEADAELRSTSAEMSAKIDGLKKSDEALAAAISQVQAGVEQSLKKEVDLTAVHASIAEVNKVSESLIAEQAGINEQLAAIAAKEVDLSGLEAEIDELASMTDAVQQEQAKIVEQLASLDAKASEIASIQAKIAELGTVSEAVHKEQGGIAKQLTDLAAKDIDLSPIQAGVAELHAFVEALQCEQAAASEKLTGIAQSIESAEPVDVSPIEAGVAELRAYLESLQTGQAESGEKIAALASALDAVKPKDYDASFQQLTKSQSEAAAAIAGVSEKVDLVASRDSADQFAGLAEHQARIEANLAELKSKIDKIEIPSPAKELGEISAHQKQHLEAHQKLVKQLAELHEATAHSASAIEAKIADVSTRTDQREAILLSLQSRVADTEGQSAGASEVLPMVADLRMEMQGLAADQAKVSAALEGLAQTITKAGSAKDPDVQSLLEDQAKLAAALAEIGESLHQMRTEAAEKPEPVASEEPKIQAALDAMSSSLAQWKADAEANQKSLEARLAAALSSGEEGASREAIVFDQSGIQASIESLSGSLAQWKLESEASQKALEARLSDAISSVEVGVAPTAAPVADESKIEASLETLSESLIQWKIEADENHKALEARIASVLASAGDAVSIAPVMDDSKLESALNSLSTTIAQNLSQWRADAEKSQHDFEAHMIAELAKIERHRAESAPKFDVSQATFKNHNDEESAKADAHHAHEEKKHAHAHAEPIVIDLVSLGTFDSASEEVELADADLADDDAADGSEHVPAPSGWPVLGGSQSRRWSAPVDREIQIISSDKHLTALTPIITPGTEHKLGPMLFLTKKVLYGHGTKLKGMWPGKGESNVILQEELPADAWRLIAFDGHAFCVEEDQVELVNLSSWNVVARFSGTYIDQICTKTHWVGLASSMGSLYLDSRNLLGRQLGEPVKLAMKAGDAKSLAADGERIFVASRDGKVYRVELGDAKQIISAEKGDVELISLSTQKSGLVALIRTKDHDIVRTYSFDGKIQKQLPLDFKHGYDHPVLIADRLYLLDIEKKKLVVCNIKKAEIAGSVELPGEQISSFCGVFHEDQHALLISVAEKDHSSGKVIAIDPQTGDHMAICDVNERQIQVIAADSRIVVASSCFYQNMIRIFDPFKEQQELKAA